MQSDVNMRILVVGAGAIGGYLEARLLEGSRDVTFLVRPRRAAELARGLFVKSRYGDVAIASPPTMLAEHLREPFDLILVCCKAYDFEDAMASFAPGVAASTAIVPLLQWDASSRSAGCALRRRARPRRTVPDLGGTRPGRPDPALNPNHELAFGERDGSLSPRARAIAAALGGAKFSTRLSEQIVHEMWEKWVLVAAVGGITCLMRATVGDIASAGAGGIAHALFDERVAHATRSGFAPGAGTSKRSARCWPTATRGSLPRCPAMWSALRRPRPTTFWETC